MVPKPAEAAVLIVEDDADLRYVYRTTLTVAGFAVREASDGYQALVAIDEDPPDVVLLDLMLPRISGFTVLDELDARRDSRTPAVVVMTGLAGVERQDVTVLRKPVELPAVIAAIRAAIRRRSSH